MSGAGLRVGILVPRFAPFRGGVETYVMSAAAELASRSVQVTVITQAPRANALRQHEYFDGYSVERHHLPIGDSYDIPSLAAARAASRRGRFDVLWVHSYHTPLAWLAAEQATAPVVFTPHYHGVGHTPVRLALHRVYRPAGMRLMGLSCRILVDTNAEADLVLRDFPQRVSRKKIRVIPPAVVDPRGHHRPYADAADIVLTVARQETYKRTDLLVRAVAELRRRRVDARLVVIGQGHALEASRRLAMSLGLDDMVTIAGEVDDEVLGRWWASASVYATASLQEAFGIGLAQALAAGLPVVASDIPAHREVVAQAGPTAVARLCGTDARDTDLVSLYADAIASALADRGSRQERAERCAIAGTQEVSDRLLTVLSEVGEQARL